MENQTQKTNLNNSWNHEDIEKLAKALTFVYKNQKTYAQPLDLADRVEGWKFVLEDRYPMESVLSALRRYMTENPDMPAPADIEAILNPPIPKITQTEFIHAKEQHALEGYPMHGYYGGIIKKYEAQEQEAREAPRELTDAGRKLIHEAMKAIK